MELWAQKVWTENKAERDNGKESKTEATRSECPSSGFSLNSYQNIIIELNHPELFIAFY